MFKTNIPLTLLLGEGDEVSLRFRIPPLGDPDGEYMAGMDLEGEF